MRLSKNAGHYWSLTVVTVAVCMAVPFTQTQQSNSFSTQSTHEYRAGAGYSRPAGSLPFYGFDNPNNSQIDKLDELNANTIIVGSLWNESQQKFEQTMRKLKGAGLRVIVQVTDTHDWLDGTDFVIKRATRLLAQARNQGVGQLADMIIIEGDAIGFANQLQRQQAYRLAKEYFPNTPVVRRYGQSIEWAEAMHGKPHPMGGAWDDYRFGPDECDVALINVGRGVDDNAVGVRIAGVLDQLNHLVALVKSRQPEVAIIVGAQFAPSSLLESKRSAMWSPKEIDQFVSAILTSVEVEGLLFQGLGSYRYDLANAEFSSQRLAFRQAAPRGGRSIASER